MKFLIAVCSCQRDKKLGQHDQIRISYGRALSSLADVRFFMGGDEPKDLLQDEVWLNAPDNYRGLPAKMREVIRWALNHGYDYVWKVDCDTRIFSQDFEKFPFGHYDYVGKFLGHEAYASGGGYGLSRRAMEVVLAFDGRAYWAEDVVTGEALRDHPEMRIFRLGYKDLYFARQGGGLPHDPAPQMQSAPQMPWRPTRHSKHGRGRFI